MWEEEPSKRWMELCSRMQRHQHKVPPVSDRRSAEKMGVRKCVSKMRTAWAIRLGNPVARRIPIDFPLSAQREILFLAREFVQRRVRMLDTAIRSL